MPRQSRKLGRTLVRKEKKTFTLSRESVNFLEDEKRKRALETSSLVLEEILDECRKKQSTQKNDNAISAYYDSLSKEEKQDNRVWGEFAETQFPLD